MAIATVTEYESLAEDSRGNTVPVPMEPAIASQSVSYTTSAAVTNAFNKRTRFVYVQTNDTNGHVKFGASPTAAATDRLIIAGDGAFFGVHPLIDMKVAVYDGSS